MESTFFAAISREKYIDRWALMRNARPENLCEHSMEVAVIAHALCTFGNVRLGKQLDADRAAVIALYHDTTEIITGDMPTPVKYLNQDIRGAYKEVERVAEDRLLSALPEDLKSVYEGIFRAPEPTDEEIYIRRLVKAADKLSALIKCIDERMAGNTEFRTAESTVRSSVEEMAARLPEVKMFVEEFLPAYGRTLDELL